MFSILKRLKQDSAGNVGMMFAVSLTALAIGAGAAIDFAILKSKEAKLQGAVDAATLYAASIRDTDSFESDALFFLNEKLQDLKLSNVESSFDIEGSNIIGQTSARVNLNFAEVLNREFANISTKSVVTVPTAGRPCIVLLDKNRGGALTLNSGAQVDAGSCEVHVHSTANNAVASNSGSQLQSKRTCVAGKAQINYGGVVTNLEENCEVADDPFAGEVPVPADLSCDYYSTNYNGGHVHLEPGVYCGWFAFQGSGLNVNMNPGLYVIKGGGWNLNSGDWTGHGVTIYFDQGSQMNFNSGVDLDLKAPSSGEYANILMAETPSNWDMYQNLNDSHGYDFEGVIYLPGRHLTLNSGANVSSQNLTIVAKSLIVNDVNLSADSYGEAEAKNVEVYLSE